MRKLLIIPVFLAALLVGGCGEKPCNSAGSVKVEHGKSYICGDRQDGNGLRWYPN